jgi:hypothetical protein
MEDLQNGENQGGKKEDVERKEEKMDYRRDVRNRDKHNQNYIALC